MKKLFEDSLNEKLKYALEGIRNDSYGDYDYPGIEGNIREQTKRVDDLREVVLAIVDTLNARSGLKPQSPSTSEQVVGTPRDFIKAVERRYGKFTWDLAATAENAKAPYWITEETDSLKQTWPSTGISWLNPPFAKMTPWAKKCAEWTKLPGRSANARIIMLTPASVGSNWFNKYVRPNADVITIPRLTFEGSPDPYPKDLMISVFGSTLRRFTHWDYRLAPKPMFQLGQ